LKRQQRDSTPVLRRPVEPAPRKRTLIDGPEAHPDGGDRRSNAGSLATPPNSIFD
jgi:hypothetical protein